MTVRLQLRGVTLGTVALLLITFHLAKAEETLGPLISISPSVFLQIEEHAQVAYVAGVIDGVSYTSYGYNIPSHNEFVRCARKQSLGALTERVVAWLKAHPNFKEGTATAVTSTIGEICGHSH